jgi:8-hydroxy-5-deazaflavin:NADPH oxidoreductase
MTTIGILGSGNVGSNLARAAIAHGYSVLLSNTRGPDSMAGLVSGARAPRRGCHAGSQPRSTPRSPAGPAR